MAEITTNRLILRPFQPTDDAELFVLRSNVEAMRHIPRPRAQTLADARELLNRISQSEQEGTGKAWAICLKDTGSLIGFIGFVRMEKEHRKSEVGYQLLPIHWRKGYVTEAMKPILQEGFEVLNLHRVEAHIDPENQASLKLAEKVGFIKEAHLREHLYVDGRFLDTQIYGMLRNDWLRLYPSSTKAI